MRLTANNIMVRAWDMAVRLAKNNEFTVLTTDDFRKLENDLASVMAQLLAMEIAHDTIVVANTPILFRRCKALAFFFVEECRIILEKFAEENVEPVLDQFPEVDENGVFHTWAALLYEMQHSIYNSINQQRDEILEAIAAVFDLKYGTTQHSAPEALFRLLNSLTYYEKTIGSIEEPADLVNHQALNESEFDAVCTLLEACLKLDGIDLMQIDDRKFDESSPCDQDTLCLLGITLSQAVEIVSVKEMQQYANEKTVVMFGSSEKHSRIMFRITIDKEQQEPISKASIEVMIALFTGGNEFKSYGFMDLNILTTEYRRSVIEKLDSAVFVDGIYQQ